MGIADKSLLIQSPVSAAVVEAQTLPSTARRTRLGLRGWLRSLEIISVACLFGAYLYLDLLAATDGRKVKGRSRRLLHWLGKKVLAQGVLQREERIAKQAVWLRSWLLKLGPTFIKIGQALATRADLLPLAYVRELTKLQDEVPPFPQALARTTIEEELGASIPSIFAHLDDRPVAAASLGQVYYGRLHDGQEVAVKVQRPRLRETIDLDLRILNRIVKFLKRYPNLFRGIDWSGVLNEFAFTIFQEMDYIQEGRNAERFRESFLSWQDVYVPHIFWRFTSKRVLTMEYIHGFKVTDLEALRANGITGAKVNRLLARTYLKQMLEDGFFHADPHPGNLRVMPDGRLAFFDFGMAGCIEERIQILMIDAFFHILNRDVRELVNDLMNLEFLDQGTDPDTVRPLVEDLFKEYLGLKLRDIHFKELTYEIADVVYEYHFRIPSRFMYLIRALMQLEGIGVATDPDFNFVDVARPFARQYLFRREARQLRNGLLAKLLRGENNEIRLDKIWYLTKVAVKIVIDKVQAKLDERD